MNNQVSQVDQLIVSLKERTKELNCLYQVVELLRDYDMDIDLVFEDMVKVIPLGWQYSDSCMVRILYDDKIYHSPGFYETEWKLSAYLEVQGNQVGYLEVYYTKEFPRADKGPFLESEVKFIVTIANRLGDFIQHKNLKHIIKDAKDARTETTGDRKSEWRIVVDMSRRMDRELFMRIARKMLNYLCWNGVKEANEILQQISSDKFAETETLTEGDNRPQARRRNLAFQSLNAEIFNTAERNLPDDEILACVRKWMQEDRASFLIKTLVALDSSLGDIADSIRRFIHLSPDGIELSDSTLKGLRVSLVRRIITEQLNFISIAKNHVEIEDFYHLIKRMIFPVGSRGQIGGKSAGLFLAWQILKNYTPEDNDLFGIKLPKTWYITSDGLHHFMRNNNLEEVTEQKYKDVSQVRQEYPHIIQLFKNSQFTPEIIQGLSMALDDFGNKPIIVRSSSLLEDNFGSAFSGKYKSLFLANQGSKDDRLQALMDAIAEVYSSTFGSDPLEYRAERGLTDFKEEMGIIIQEVVGSKVNNYFLPSFAGVAFSNNEFRWSPRIKREDGLIRMVPGLGTRAVDRLSDDFPILIAPGQPNLRVNVSLDEIIRYSPNKMDVINLQTNRFETVEIKEFMKQHGDDFPAVMKLISVVKDDRIQQPSLMSLDFENDEVVVTFEGLTSNTTFVHQIHKIMKILQDTMGVPVDIEFASDGKDFYLLQCRPQGTTPDQAPAPIPKDIPESAIVFTANQHVTNGTVPGISHIVYVDPQKYSEIEDHDTLLEVGRVVSRLNKLLPKHRFILMGPGRWGSRGDIKLGVSITYSDINNTAMLIEIARQKGNYVPDLSFGTHFFQDLVEASIRYLPLYPDDKNILFNDRFLTKTHNILPDILPEYKYLEKVVRVIDVPEAVNGKVLNVYMNADLDEALGVLSQSADAPETTAGQQVYAQTRDKDDNWRWRLRMAERIAEDLDPDRFGVAAYYIFGSTKNCTAKPDSDIDLLIHFRGSEEQKEALLQWFEGWSLALDEMNYLCTGYRVNGILDIHFVTDEDIRDKSNYAVKIGAVTDAAREIPL
ncbi:MAG: PEP/pyruvate-binding domain-containing protein [Candidatus Hatepunaea meridiana]|nr:PEP/pyruvate-binding domain-containing protein [Candidatus Hatepunaea meridiana]